MSAMEAECANKMDLDDSGCVQDECSLSKPKEEEEELEDVQPRSIELLDFSDEVLFYILKFCTPHTLKALGFTCARLGALVLERSLWNHVDARDVCTNRSRMRWMVQNFHVGTRAVFLHGYAAEARGCRGHVNRTRKEAEEDKPRFASALSCLAGGDAHSFGEIEVPLGVPPPPLAEPAAPVADAAENGGGDNRNGEEERRGEGPQHYPLQRLPARLHMNAINAQHLPRQRGSPTWPEECEWDDEEEQPQESTSDTAGCAGPVFTLSADIMRELCIRCPRLYELSLEYCNINCNKINLSSFPTALRRLSLKGTRCYNPPLDKSYLFRIHDYLPVLEYLDLSECAWVEPAVLLPLSKMAHLETLLMRACPSMAEFVAYVSLATRYGFRKLKVWDMRSSPVGDSEVSALGWLPELEELRLSAPRPAPRAPPPHHHYLGDPLPRRPGLDQWEMQIPPYYQSRCEEGSDSPDCGEDIEGQLSAVHCMPPLSIEVRTRLRLPSRNPPNQPANPPNPPAPPQPDTRRRKQSGDAPGPLQKRTKRNSTSKDSDDSDSDDESRDNNAEMDTTDRDDSLCDSEDKDNANSNSDSSPDKSRKSSEDESKSRYRIFKHKNTFDVEAGPSAEGNEDQHSSGSTSPEKGATRRYVYKLNYGPLSNQNDDDTPDKSKDPKTESNDEDKNEQNETKIKEEASTSKQNVAEDEQNAKPSEEKVDRMNEGEDEQNAKPSEEKVDRMNEGEDEQNAKPSEEKADRMNEGEDEQNTKPSEEKVDRMIEGEDEQNAKPSEDKVDRMNEGEDEQNAKPSEDKVDRMNEGEDEQNAKPSEVKVDRMIEGEDVQNTKSSDEKVDGMNEGEDEQNAKPSGEKVDRMIEGEEDKPKTENEKVEDNKEQKTEPNDEKTEKCNEGASCSKDKEDSGENKPEGSAEESNEPRAGPSNSGEGKTTYRCRIDVNDGASTSRYSIRVQVKNELLRAHEGGEENRPAREGGGEPMVEDVPAEAVGQQPAAPASPPAGCVRFRRGQPPVVLRVPVPPPEEQQVEPRHHVLYVNLGQQLHAVYRLLPHRAPAAPPAPPVDHLEPHSLVSDTSIRRFGRADGENVNIVNIGPDGPQFGDSCSDILYHLMNPRPTVLGNLEPHLLVSDFSIRLFGRADGGYIGPNGLQCRGRDNSGRPNRSNLRILSASGYRNITNRSLVHLATAAPHLQLIDFTNTGVNAQGVEQFKSLRPEVEVTYSEFKSEDDIEE